jgi:cytochrome c
MGCHAIEPGRHRAGPSLHGVLGREAGSAPGYDFSTAMAAAGIVWTPETLDAFLAAPAEKVPGTNMVFWGLDPASREAVTRYLAAAAE